VLDELIPFLEARSSKRAKRITFLSRRFHVRATLFEHCALALDASLAVGRHGLPLIGTGDWNDGMNRVGEKGEGESVWLGWFLHAALTVLCAVGAGAKRGGARGDMDGARGRAEGLHRARDLGRRMVSQGLFR
jgi:cyclic beta-1,2-glucan synthetase